MIHISCIIYETHVIYHLSDVTCHNYIIYHISHITCCDISLYIYHISQHIPSEYIYIYNYIYMLHTHDILYTVYPRIDGHKPHTPQCCADFA